MREGGGEGGGRRGEEGEGGRREGGRGEERGREGVNKRGGERRGKGGREKRRGEGGGEGGRGYVSARGRKQESLVDNCHCDVYVISSYLVLLL